MDNFCIEITKINKFTLHKWLNNSYILMEGDYVGIENNVIVYRSNPFNRILTYEEFLKYLIEENKFQKVFKKGNQVIAMNSLDKDYLNKVSIFKYRVSRNNDHFFGVITDGLEQICDIIYLKPKKRKFKIGPIDIKDESACKHCSNDYLNYAFRHGLITIDRSKPINIVEYIEDDYIVEYTDTRGNIVKLAFKQEDLKLVEEEVEKWSEKNKLNFINMYKQTTSLIYPKVQNSYEGIKSNNPSFLIKTGKALI